MSTSVVPGNVGQHEYIVGQIVDITQRKRDEEQREVSLQHATILWRIGHLVSSQASVNEVGQAAVDGVIKYLECDVAFLFEMKGEELPLVALAGCGKSGFAT